MNHSNAPLLSLRQVSINYEYTPVIGEISLDIPPRAVTAFIGPKGTGKTSLLLAMNRMLELQPHFEIDGAIFFQNMNIYDPSLAVEELRRRLSYIGPEPTCFPRTIWENIAWGARIHGFSGDMDALVENSLRKAGLWDEVKDILRRSALRLSGGQRQRLSLARALAVQPDALLLDEPTSRLDPIATGRIEDVIISLKNEITIAIATHDHLQAGRLAEKTALFLPGKSGYGELIEFNDTEVILVNPHKKRTEDYVTGKHQRRTRYTL